MSFRSSLSIRQLLAVFGFSVAMFAFAVLAPASGASMKGSYYKAMLKEKKSKSKAASATKAAMKGTSGFYGFKLKPKYIPGKNGTLIWAKKESGKKNPAEASSTHNVLYSSKSFPGNRKTVVSGTVMVPKGKAPNGGWPVVSWAHGTVGLADQCAPSRRLGSTEYYGSESGDLIKGWLKAGYAVVATDYEGLGTPGIHPYLVGDSEGRGVLDIVLAARQLDGKVSKRVALAGHSQGGQAILFAANLATTSWGKGANYLGTVSYAPASNLNQQAPLISSFDNQPGQYGITALALQIARGAVASNSAIKPKNLLTDAGWKEYPKTETLCSSELASAVEKVGLKPGQLLKPGWENTPDGRRFNEALVKMNPAVKVGAPVLIPQGDADTTVLPAFTSTLVGQLRQLNPNQITYETFSGADHSGILLASRTEVDLFIRTLFNP